MSGEKRTEKTDQKNGGNGGDNGRAERQSRIRAIMDRKAQKAALADTAVVYSRVPETVRLIQIMERGGDFAVSKLRKGLAVRYETDKALPLLEEIAEATRRLSKAISAVCKLTEVSYDPPKGLMKDAGKKAEKP